MDIRNSSKVLTQNFLTLQTLDSREETNHQSSKLKNFDGIQILNFRNAFVLNAIVFRLGERGVMLFVLDYYRTLNFSSQLQNLKFKF